MTQELHTHISSLALHLSLLKDQENVPESEEGEYIGELTSASAAFALNGIPTITVSVPHGVRVKDGKLENAYVYFSTLNEAIKDRKGVGVYLDIQGDVPGLPTNTCACLFKGYILEQSVQNNKEGGSSQFGIVHWLTDLTNIAMVNRLSSPDNSADVSNDSAFQQFDSNSSQNKSSWIPGNAYSEALKKPDANVYDALKVGMIATMEGEGNKLREDQPASINRDKYYRKAKAALEAVKAECLKFSSDVGMTDSLINAMSAALSLEQRATHISTTIWQKLVQTFMPQYYLALVPLIDKALVIPQPGIQITEDNCTEIPDTDIVGVSTRTKHGKVLGAVFLSSRTATQESSLIPVNTFATKFQYPIPAETGVMKACSLPAWLECYLSMTRTLHDATASFTDFANMDQQIDEVEPEDADACQRLCKLFTKAVYHAEVTRGNTASVTTIPNLMIAPGTPVKFKVPKDVLAQIDDTWVYGVVEKMQYTISNTNLNTIFTLSDLRVGKAQMEKFKLDNALIYETAWDGSLTTMYAFEKEVNGKPRIEEAKCKPDL